MESQLQYAGLTLADTLADADADKNPLADLAPEHHRRIVIAFVGLAFEARIAAGPGVLVVCRGPGRQLAAAAESALRQGYRGIVSFGVAGGLAPELRAGDWVIASAIQEAHTVRETDAKWSSRLLNVIGGARHAPIVGVDDPVAEPAAKQELHRRTGAAAVDMESHVVARLAAAHGLAFTAVRVIVDSADRPIPRAALRGLGVGGPTNVLALLRELVARPSELSPLARIAIDAFAARAELLRVRRLLGPHFGLTDSESLAAVTPAR